MSRMLWNFQTAAISADPYSIKSKYSQLPK